MFGRYSCNWPVALFLSLFALIGLLLIDAQYTAPGAYYVYAPGYNFNPPPPGPGGPGTVGKRSAGTHPSTNGTENGKTVTGKSTSATENHISGTKHKKKRNAETVEVGHGHSNGTEHHRGEKGRS